MISRFNLNESLLLKDIASWFCGSTLRVYAVTQLLYGICSRKVYWDPCLRGGCGSASKDLGRRVRLMLTMISFFTSWMVFSPRFFTNWRLRKEKKIDKLWQCSIVYILYIKSKSHWLPDSLINTQPKTAEIWSVKFGDGFPFMMEAPTNPHFLEILTRKWWKGVRHVFVLYYIEEPLTYQCPA